MNLGVLHSAMLLGLCGAAVPVVIHFLNRRRDVLIDWGAMQFLQVGHKARQKLRLTEVLLMLARVGLLAAVALALARPYWTGPKGGGGAGPGLGAFGGGPARDVVLVFDGSASMDRGAGDQTPRAAALAWARRFVGRLGAGDSLALLVAGDRVRPVIDPPSFDHARSSAALDALAKRPGRGSSDMAGALSEAFRLLERTQNPAREVIVLGDGQRVAWKPADAARWALVRDFGRRLPVTPRVWALTFRGGEPGLEPANTTAAEANGALGPLTLSRALVTPGVPLAVSADLTNLGPGPLTRPAELLVDGAPVAGSARTVGPLPPGGKAPLRFEARLSAPGSHLVTVRLAGIPDPLPGDDASSAALEVIPALGVLLVDGERGTEPLSSETDFLRAALAPGGDDAPQARATVVTPEGFTAESLRGQNVVVLANLNRPGFDQAPALARFLEAGGGVLVAPGDRVDPASYNALGWLPAKLGPLTGDFGARAVVARPNPPSFTGPVLSAFGAGRGAGDGDGTPALGRAGLFGYYKLEPAPEGTVVARLDGGDPWAVERAVGRGRALLLAGPLDAEGGTLPVNPDFVPLVHEWAFRLAGGDEPRVTRPGEPLSFDLNPSPPAGTLSLPLLTPDGTEARAVVTRTAGLARARFDDTSESGVYRLTLPTPPGGFAYTTVRGDADAEARESDPAPLETAEAERLARGWPLAFEADPDALAARIDSGGTAGGGRSEFWRVLVGAALAGLCVEIYLTRQLARGQGLTAGPAPPD